MQSSIEMGVCKEEVNNKGQLVPWKCEDTYRPFELEGNLDEHVSRNRVDVVNLGTRGTIRARWFWVDDVL